MAASPVLPEGLTAAQYQSIFAGVGTYKGNDAAYKGKSWGAVYAALWQANQATKTPLSPYQIALKVEVLVVLQGLGTELTTSIATFVNDAGNSGSGLQNFPGAGLLSGLDAIGGFFSSLGEASTWIRVLKVVFGGVLIISGLVRLTGAGKAAIGVAGKAAVLA